MRRSVEAPALRAQDGEGTRGDASALDAAQERAADAGLKAMMPVGRPFLEYVLSALADAGIEEVVAVVAPGEDAVREHFTTTPPTRLAMRFVVQDAPRGTADALYAARSAVRDAPFLMLNSDNYYPVEAFHALAALGAPGLVAFEAETLIRESGIEPDRVLRYAFIEADADGFLREVTEKPSSNILTSGRGRWVSMNLWSFTAPMFDACARVKPSIRGELELQDAVTIAMREFGMRFRVVPMRAGVLDLSSRADVRIVAARLAGITARP